MTYRQKLTYTAAGFFAGNIILAALIFGFSGTPNRLTFNDAVKRVQSSDVKEINIETNRADSPDPADSDLLIRLFQILFWLFLISPPIIVVLLLVIISKMNRKNSLE